MRSGVPSRKSPRRQRPQASSAGSRRSRSWIEPQLQNSEGTDSFGVQSLLWEVAPPCLHRRLQVAQPLQLFRARLADPLELPEALPLAPPGPPFPQRSHGRRSDVRSAAMLRRVARAWRTTTVSATGTSSRYSSRVSNDSSTDSIASV